MRIIGGRDYYDSALSQGRDETLVFQRQHIGEAAIVDPKAVSLIPLKTNRFRFKGAKNIPTSAIRDGRNTWHFNMNFIWFAGKRYGLIHVTLLANDEKRALVDQHWFWNHASCMDFLKSHDAVMDKNPRYIFDRHILDDQNIMDFFHHVPTIEESQWLIENRVAIAIWCTIASDAQHSGPAIQGWALNTDGLQDRGFAKCLDPFSAFQELSMWIGGVLPRSGRPMIEITDEKVMLAKHGMDDRSFKKPPRQK